MLTLSVQGGEGVLHRPNAFETKFQSAQVQRNQNLRENIRAVFPYITIRYMLFSVCVCVCVCLCTLCCGVIPVFNNIV